MTHEWYFLRPSQDDMTGQIDLRSAVDMDINTSSWLAGLGQPIDSLLPEDDMLDKEEEFIERDGARARGRSGDSGSVSGSVRGSVRGRSGDSGRSDDSARGTSSSSTAEVVKEGGIEGADVIEAGFVEQEDYLHAQEETSQQAKYKAIKTEIMQAYDNAMREFVDAKEMWSRIDAKAKEMVETLPHDKIVEHTRLYGEAANVWRSIEVKDQVLREQMKTTIQQGFTTIDDAVSRNNLIAFAWEQWCQRKLQRMKTATADTAAGIQELGTFLDRLEQSSYRHK